MDDLKKQRVLKEALIEAFSLDDLADLCHSLGVDGELIPGQGKAAKAREMVQFFARRGRFEPLWQEVERLRPNLRLAELLANAPDFAPEETETPGSPHDVPTPPVDFVGREAELESLTGAVESGRASIIGVQGLGGIGKTTLASKLAEQLRPRCPDGSVIIEMNGVEANQALRPERAIEQLLHKFDRTAELPKELGELKSFYRRYLHGKRVLILLDNAAGPQQVAPLLPPPPGCLVIVTSRQHFTLPGMKVMNLDALPLEDAVRLILSVAQREEAEDVEALAQACGRLPLALRLMGSLLCVSPNQTARGLVKRLKDTRRAFQIPEMDQVEASLRLSYNLLPADLKEKWRKLAVFAGDFDITPVPSLWGMTDGAVTLEPPELVLEEAQDDLGRLMGYSLVHFDQQSRRYGLHALARAYAVQRMSAEEEYEARFQHAALFLYMLNTANILYHEGHEAISRGLALFDRERREIEAGQAWAASGGEAPPEKLKLRSEYAWRWSVLNLRLHPQAYIRWLNAALNAARLLQDQRAEGAHLGNLGLTYADLGEARRAIEYYEQHMVIARATGDRRGEGADLGNLGNAYADLGEARRAIEYYEQRLGIARAIGDRRGEANALGSLGLAYAVLGDVQRAIEYFEQALTIDRATGDRRGQGTTLGNLGNAYAALGDVQRAIEYYEQALTIDRATGDRRGQGTTLGNLGNAYAALGDAQQAIEYYEQALVIAREIGDRRGEGNASWNLGLRYEAQGNLTRAAALMQVLVDFEREIGHPDAEKHAARVEELRQKLREADGSSE